MQLASAIFQQVKDLVVNITVYSKLQGVEGVAIRYSTGFIIDCTSGLLIVTNAHTVLVNPPALRVPPGYSPNFSRHQRIFITLYRTGHPTLQLEVEVIGVDRGIDVAIITPITLIPIVKGLSWGPIPSIGDQVFVVGNTDSADPRSISSGIVRNNNHVLPDQFRVADSITVDAPIATGNSGSPLLDAQGRVIALVFAVGPGDLTYTIPAYVVKRIIDDILGCNYLVIECISDVYGSFKRRIAVALPAVVGYYTPSLILPDDIEGIIAFDSVVGIYVRSIEVGSILEGIISIGDIIVSIGGANIGIGQTNCQVGLATALLPIVLGSSTCIAYRTISSSYTSMLTASVVLPAIGIEEDIAPFTFQEDVSI